MKYALLIVETEPSDDGALALRNFAHSIAALKMQSLEVERLNGGCYLIPLVHGLHALTHLSHEAQTRQLRTRTLFFESDPAWVTSNFKV